MRLIRRQRNRAQGDEGMSLVELLVGMSLIGVLGTVLVLGMQNNQKLHRTTVDESAGLADVKTVVERLGRDIRSARSVDAAASQSRLVLWIDSNSDYLKSNDEIVTWQLVQTDDSSGHYNVLRQTEGGLPKIQARTLITNLAFCYWTQAGDPNATACTGSLPVPLSATSAGQVRLITTTTTYDAITTTGTQSRQVAFSSRLRNVG
jgi:prepilin-type N-terminal cleavage/methylation domain-containing protein